MKNGNGILMHTTLFKGLPFVLDVKTFERYGVGNVYTLYCAYGVTFDVHTVEHRNCPTEYRVVICGNTNLAGGVFDDLENLLETLNSLFNDYSLNTTYLLLKYTLRSVGLGVFSYYDDFIGVIEAIEFGRLYRVNYSNSRNGTYVITVDFGDCDKLPNWRIEHVKLDSTSESEPISLGVILDRKLTIQDFITFANIYFYGGTHVSEKETIALVNDYKSELLVLSKKLESLTQMYEHTKLALSKIEPDIKRIEELKEKIHVQ